MIQLLRNIGVRPSRKLGQNFLLDKNLLQYISETIRAKRDELIIEIGSGTGFLTDYLATAKSEIVSIEYDVRLFELLQDKYCNVPTITVIHGDAARIDYDTLTQKQKYRCVGNLPYSASSIILVRLMSLYNRPDSMFLLLQKEMAARITSQPGCKSYGALSIRAQTLYNLKNLRTIPPQVFWPVPEVESSFVQFRLKKDPLEKHLFDEFSKIVRLAFSNRRKKLISNLTKQFNSKLINGAFEKLEIIPNSRAEALTPEQYLKMSRIILGDEKPKANNYRATDVRL